MDFRLEMSRKHSQEKSNQRKHRCWILHWQTSNKEQRDEERKSEKIGMLMVCAGNIPLMTPFISIFYDLLHNCGGTGSQGACDLVFNL